MTLAFLRLLEEYMGASYERKMELEKQYGKNLLQRGQQEMETNTWMLSNAQKCPNCSTFFLLSHMKSRVLFFILFFFRLQCSEAERLQQDDLHGLQWCVDDSLSLFQ